MFAVIRIIRKVLKIVSFLLETINQRYKLMHFNLRSKGIQNENKMYHLMIQLIIVPAHE